MLIGFKICPLIVKGNEVILMTGKNLIDIKITYWNNSQAQ